MSLRDDPTRLDAAREIADHGLVMARVGSLEEAMEAVTQLKREADDLCRAVAAVEAALITNAAARERGVAG